MGPDQPSAYLRYRPLLLFGIGLLIYLPCLLLQRPRTPEQGPEPIPVAMLIGFVIAFIAAPAFVGTSSALRELGGTRKAYLIGAGLLLFGILVMGVWDFLQNHHRTASFVIPVLIAGLGLCVSSLAVLVGLASWLLTHVRAGADAVPRRVWLAWSALMVLAGAFLVIDIQRVRNETDVWQLGVDVIRDPNERPGYVNLARGPRFVTIAQPSYGRKAIQHYSNGILQRVYVGVSEGRGYANMHEFETEQGKRYCAAVIEMFPQQQHGLPKGAYLYGQVFASVYGKHGTVPCIQYDVTDAFRAPVDQRDFGQRTRDYLILSHKLVSGGVALLLLAGLGLVGLAAYRGRQVLGRAGVHRLAATADRPDADGSAQS